MNKIKEFARNTIENVKVIPQVAKEWLNRKKKEKPDKTLSQKSCKALLGLGMVLGGISGVIKVKEYVQEYNPLGSIQYSIQNLENRVQLKIYEAIHGEVGKANTFSPYQKPDINGNRPKNETPKTIPNIEEEDRGIVLNEFYTQLLEKANFDFDSYYIMIQTKVLGRIRQIIGKDNKISNPEETTKARAIVKEQIKKYLPEITTIDLNTLAKDQKVSHTFTQKDLDFVMNQLIEEETNKTMKLLQKTLGEEVKSGRPIGESDEKINQYELPNISKEQQQKVNSITTETLGIKKLPDNENDKTIFINLLRKEIIEIYPSPENNPKFQELARSQKHQIMMEYNSEISKLANLAIIRIEKEAKTPQKKSTLKTETKKTSTILPKTSKEPSFEYTIKKLKSSQLGTKKPEVKTALKSEKKIAKGDMSERDRIEAQTEYLLSQSPNYSSQLLYPANLTLTPQQMIEHNKQVKTQKIIEEEARLKAVDLVKSNRDINKI